MAERSYWEELYQSVDRLTDEEFAELIQSVGGIEDCPIIIDELYVSYKISVNDISYSSASKRYSSILTEKMKDNQTIQVGSDCLIANQSFGTSCLEAA